MDMILQLYLLLTFGIIIILTAEGIDERDQEELTEAKNFMNKTDAELKKWSNKMANANWNYESNLTSINRKEKETASKAYGAFLDHTWKSLKEFHWANFEKKDPTLYRWFLLLNLTRAQNLNKQIDTKELKKTNDSKQDIQQKMADIFSKAVVCPYKKDDTNRNKCNIPYDPDIMNIMQTSRDYNELKHYWVAFRNATGRKMRKLYPRFVEIANKNAKKLGYSDAGNASMSIYETPTLYREVKSALNKIMPLYKQIHAYVRKKLRKVYRKQDVNFKDGPIPAHILGDMYAQRWAPLYGMVNPYKNQSAPNVTNSLKMQGMKPLDLFIIAEKFFTSIGLKRMTPHFWSKSIFEKPVDRDIVCHASAHDFSDGKDFRIRMCSNVNDYSFKTIHHEMGHIEYYQHYQNLPQVFQDSANPGFHEAIGDTIALSALTSEYLNQIGLLKKEDIRNNTEADISYLMNAALIYVTGLPYAFLIDDFRYKVYNKSVKAKSHNELYWKLRLEYQGVCPPVERTRKDFDPGAKYHIPFNVEYMRYFISNILQFQIHKALCEEKNHIGPLFKCNIYKNQKSGKLLKDILKIGKSKHWKEAMKLISKSEKQKIVDVKPLLEYFRPLYDWLKKENKKEYIGWKSEFVMKCPMREKTPTTMKIPTM